MAKNIHVAKITASSTPTAWAQSYHAGNLTAVVTVSPKAEEDATSLHIVGKDLLNTFESEYFTIENKTLASVKDAVETTCKKSSETHDISFLVGSLVKNTLYVVLAGKGSIYLIRDGKLGTLLEQQDGADILSSSGFLEHGDIVVLASDAFLQLVQKEKLFETLTQNPLEEAAELLSPTIHAATEGTAAALFFQYEDDSPHTTHSSATQPIQEGTEEKEDKHEEIPQHHPISPLHYEEVQKPHVETQKEEPIFSEPLTPSRVVQRNRISHRRRVLLTIIIILLVVLGGTVYFAMSHQREAKNTDLFNATFPQAEKKYDEAQGLMELNPSLAKNDLTNAKDQLSSLNNQLIANSAEQKKTQDLINKVADALENIDKANSVNTTKVDATTSVFLSYANSNPDKSYISEDTTNIFAADDTNVTQVNKSTSSAKKIITNTNIWKTVGGFEKYLDNFYLLDNKNGIIKFVPSGSSYTKSTYFATGVSPDLSNAIHMAIDGSVWILEKDGTVLKFTKGKQDNFALSGLNTPLASPTRIVTSVTMDNVYILDNGNGRIVQIDKTGKFVKDYTSTLLKKATQFVVDEKAKTLIFLSSGNFYQITLN